MMKRFQAINYSYKQKIGNLEYEAGYVVQVMTAFKKILKERQGISIYLCLDGTPLRNRTLVLDYKKHRESSTGYYPVSALLPMIIKKYPSIQILCAPGEEADSVGASLVYLLRGKVENLEKTTSSLNSFDLEEDPRLVEYVADLNCEEVDIEKIPDEEEIVLCTSDADWFQLLTFPNISIDKSLSCTKIDRTRETPKVVGGVEPHQITAYKSLKGDHSDNLLGVTLKNFNILGYVRSLKDENQFEEDAFSGKETALSKALWEENQYQRAYTNYLLTKLPYTGNLLRINKN